MKTKSNDYNDEKESQAVQISLKLVLGLPFLSLSPPSPSSPPLHLLLLQVRGEVRRSGRASGGEFDALGGR